MDTHTSKKTKFFGLLSVAAVYITSSAFVSIHNIQDAGFLESIFIPEFIEYAISKELDFYDDIDMTVSALGLITIFFIGSSKTKLIIPAAYTFITFGFLKAAVESVFILRNVNPSRYEIDILSLIAFFIFSFILIKSAYKIKRTGNRESVATDGKTGLG